MMHSKLVFLTICYSFSLSFGATIKGSISNAKYGSKIPALPAAIAPKRVYNVRLPPFPIVYNDAQKNAQTSAGTDLSTKLDAFFQAHLNGSSGGHGEYVVPPGVYRISKRITIPNVENVKLVMKDVEIITTSTDSHFWIMGANNVEIAGPLVLDADPIPTTQGFIVDTDFSTYLDIKPMSGYREPNLGARIMGYTPDGVMQRHYQDAVKSVEDRGNGIYRVTTAFLGGNTPLTESLSRKAFAPGNLFSTEGNSTYSSGGMNLQGVGNLYMHDIYYHTPSLTFCQNTQGILRLDRYMGQRRQGTNRLGAGGWMLCQYDGGSLDMTNSEISYNYDDLTDMNGYQSAAMAGPKPNQIYLSATHFTVGREFRFYDASNLQMMGTASIVSIDDKNPSNGVMNKISTMAKAASSHYNPGDIYWLTTMSAPITGQSGWYIADDVASRPKQLSIRNSYLHDGLAAGIQLRSADSVIATGNVVERASINCATAGFSAYWSEGGPPSNVLFSDNFCVDSPYAVGMTSPSISVWTEDFQLMRAENPAVINNVSIINNVIIGPQLGAIQVGISSDVTISGNTIYNPAVAATVADSSKPPYIISLQTVKGVEVSGNQVFHPNSTVGIAGAVPAKHFVVASNRTDVGSIKVHSNSMVGSAGSNVLANLATPQIGDLNTTFY